MLYNRRRRLRVGVMSEKKIIDLVAGITRGALGSFRFGGGVLRAVVPISVVGLTP